MSALIPFLKSTENINTTLQKKALVKYIKNSYCVNLSLNKW